MLQPYFFIITFIYFIIIFFIIIFSQKYIFHRIITSLRL